MYRRILVPVDGSAIATDGLREAIRLAKGWGIKLRLIHVVDRLSLVQALEPAPIIADLLKSMERNGNAVLEKARWLAQKDGIAVEAVLKKPARGSVSDTIVDEARRWKADLIVMGTHGQRGLTTTLLGSTAQGVIRAAKRPVLLVTPPSPGRR